MSLRTAGVIARHELRRVLRDPALIAFGLALPALLMFLIGSTFYGSSSIEIGVLDLDRSPASARMVERLDGFEGVGLRHYERRATLARDVRTRARDAGLVIPNGFGADADAGRAEVEV
ncbi:MAG: hypothetical protein M3Z03_00570, partial [Actinomycetota bacterium]|nr:hypothetical protein [Actinomycetota bacterium]